MLKDSGNILGEDGFVLDLDLIRQPDHVVSEGENGHFLISED